MSLSFIMLFLGLSLFFGFAQTYIVQQEIIISQSLVSSLIPIIITIVLTVLIEILKYIFKKEYKFNNFIGTMKTIYIIVISICLLSLLGNYGNHYFNDSSKTDTDDKTYKRTVQENNSNAVKQVGKVKTEFLNENNLYENYSYNYSITFPANYKVNYGIGKHTEIQAYDSDSGYVIVVSAVKNDVSEYFEKDLSKDEVSEIMMKNLFEKFNNDTSKTLLEKSFEKKGLSDVSLKQIRLTNYNNRFFIHATFSANVIIDNERLSVVVQNYNSFYDNKVYNFTFRCFSSYNNNSWLKVVNQVMGTVFISDYITNENV